jgi:hypothetical protein
MRARCSGEGGNETFHSETLTHGSARFSLLSDISDNALTVFSDVPNNLRSAVGLGESRSRARPLAEIVAASQ